MRVLDLKELQAVSGGHKPSKGNPHKGKHGHPGHATRGSKDSNKSNNSNHTNSSDNSTCCCPPLR